MGKKALNSSGFTLIEVLIGLTIFAIGLLALAGMQITGIQGNSRSHVITAEVAAGTGVISQILALSGDTADDDLDTDGDGAVDFADFLETEINGVSWTLADSEIDGAGNCTVEIGVDVDPEFLNSGGDLEECIGMTLINVAVTNSAGRSVAQQIMKRRY